MSFSSINFTSELHNTTVYDLNKKIDYSKTKVEERLEVVNNILDNTDFYKDYFDKYFKAGINAGNPLSEDINVCKSLEKMANYLLNSEEIKKEEDAEKTQYVFYTDRKYFDKKVNREVSIESMTKTNNQDHQQNVIHFLQGFEQNHKLSKNLKITTKDLKRDDYLGKILRDYQKFSDYISEELRNKNPKHNRYILTKTKGAIAYDMLYCKEVMLGVLKSGCTNESTNYDYNVFDFTNEVHLKGTTLLTSKGNTLMAKGLLYFKPNFEPNNVFSYILMDLQETIEEANLTDEEKQVLFLMREGYSNIEIARDLDINHVKVFRTINGIVKKVIKVGNKYDKKEEI